MSSSVIPIQNLLHRDMYIIYVTHVLYTRTPTTSGNKINRTSHRGYRNRLVQFQPGEIFAEITSLPRLLPPSPPPLHTHLSDMPYLSICSETLQYLPQEGTSPAVLTHHLELGLWKSRQREKRMEARTMWRRGEQAVLVNRPSQLGSFRAERARKIMDPCI